MCGMHPRWKLKEGFDVCSRRRMWRVNCPRVHLIQQKQEMGSWYTTPSSQDWLIDAEKVLNIEKWGNMRRSIRCFELSDLGTIDPLGQPVSQTSGDGEISRSELRKGLVDVLGPLGTGTGWMAATNRNGSDGWNLLWLRRPQSLYLGDFRFRVCCSACFCSSSAWLVGLVLHLSTAKFNMWVRPKMVYTSKMQFTWKYGCDPLHSIAVDRLGVPLFQPPTPYL